MVEELAKYPVLFYPHPTIMTEERAEILKAYVEQGGKLVIGCRSGYKQINGKCVMTAQPGLLAELTGSAVKEFTYTHAMEEPVWADFGGKRMEMPMYNDIMEIAKGSDGEDVEGAKVLAAFGSSYYAGKAALIEKQTGKGSALHLGGTFSRQNTEMLFEYLGIKEPFADLVDAPEGVELVMRRKDGKDYLFVLNYQFEAQKIVLKQQMRSVFSGEIAVGEYELPKFGVEVFEV